MVSSLVRWRSWWLRRTAGPIRGCRAGPGGAPRRRERRRPPRHREQDRAPTGSGPEPDRPIGTPSRRVSARRRPRRPGTRRSAAPARSLATASTPARWSNASARIGGWPGPSSTARCSEVSRVEPWLAGAAAGSVSNAANAVLVDDAIAGVTRSTPAGAPAKALSARHALPAALDQRRSAGEEERHIRAGGGRGAPQVVGVDRGAPGIERPVDRRGGIAAPAGEARRRPGCASRAGPRAGSCRRRGPRRAGPRRSRGARSRSPRAPGPCVRPRRRRRAGCPPSPAARARLSRSCRPSGTITEWSAWNPSGRVPRTASVRFSFAGATRTTGVTGSRPRHPKRLQEAQPVLDRQRLRAPVAGDPRRRQRGVDARLAHLRARRAVGAAAELAGEHVAEHLAPLAEPGLDEAPQRGLALRREWRRRMRLQHDHRGGDLRRRLECLRRHAQRDPHRRVELHEHREVAHPARQRRRSDRRPRPGASARPAPGRGDRSRKRCRIGLVMWYGMLATTRNGAGDERPAARDPARRPRSGRGARPRSARRTAPGGTRPARDRARSP